MISCPKIAGGGQASQLLLEIKGYEVFRVDSIVTSRFHLYLWPCHRRDNRASFPSCLLRCSLLI